MKISPNDQLWVYVQLTDGAMCVLRECDILNSIKLTFSKKKNVSVECIGSSDSSKIYNVSWDSDVFPGARSYDSLRFKACYVYDSPQHL